MSSILFFIYISGVFNEVLETRTMLTSLFFVDDLGFIASGSEVKEVVKTLEKVAKKLIEWERQNTVTYNMSKTKVVLFSKSYWQRLHKQL